MILNLSSNPVIFPDNENHFLIDGPAGALELLTLAAKNDQPKGVAVICHPHPLHQGTMHNKVVTTLTRAFHALGLHTVRFNYRGVGKSEGQFGDSIGEFADLTAVIEWVNQVLPGAKLWLAGFSFGAYIAALGAQKYACQQLYSIAPAVPNQPFSTLPALSCPWVVVQGEKDEVIPAADVYQWFERQQQKQPNMQLIKIAEGSHFFHGKLVILKELIEETFIAS